MATSTNSTSKWSRLTKHHKLVPKGDPLSDMIERAANEPSPFNFFRKRVRDDCDNVDDSSESEISDQHGTWFKRRRADLSRTPFPHVDVSPNRKKRASKRNSGSRFVIPPLPFEHERDPWCDDEFARSRAPSPDPEIYHQSTLPICELEMELDLSPEEVLQRGIASAQAGYASEDSASINSLSTLDSPTRSRPASSILSIAASPMDNLSQQLAELAVKDGSEFAKNSEGTGVKGVRSVLKQVPVKVDHNAVNGLADEIKKLGLNAGITPHAPTSRAKPSDTAPAVGAPIKKITAVPAKPSNKTDSVHPTTCASSPGSLRRSPRLH